MRSALAAMARGAATLPLARQPAAAGSGLGAALVVCRAAGLSLALAAGAALAAPRAVDKPLGCLIEPDRVAEVGSQVVGVVERLLVERGDVVAAGQPLLLLRAGVERANASVADTRSRVDADVLAASASVDLASQKVQRAEALVKQGFISEQGLDQARGEHELARQKLNQVRSQQQIWVQERRVAEEQLALRTVRSPFAGVVVERYVNAGERVEERPLLRVAVIDPLRVELMVPTAQYGLIKGGDRLNIRPELPGVDSVVASVRQIDRVLDAASNTFRVRLTLPNPRHALPAGLRCKAELPGAQAAAPLAPARNAAVKPTRLQPTAGHAPAAGGKPAPL